jgi:hypothetical protein
MICYYICFIILKLKLKNKVTIVICTFLKTYIANILFTKIIISYNTYLSELADDGGSRTLIIFPAIVRHKLYTQSIQNQI